MATSPADAAPPASVTAPTPPAPLHGVPLLVAAVRSLAAYAAMSLYVAMVGPPGVLIARLFKRPGLIYVLSHGGIGLGLALSGISSRLTGGQRIPKGRTAVYCANHTSNIDGPLLFHLLLPPRRVPALGWVAQWAKEYPPGARLGER